MQTQVLKNKKVLTVKKVAKPVKTEKGNKIPRKLIIISATLSVITIISVLLLQSKLPPQVPLFYGLPQGEEQLVATPQLIIPGLFSLMTLGINFAIAYLVNDDFLTKALIISSLAISFAALITTFEIIFLLGNF